MEFERQGSQLLLDRFPVLGFPDQERAVKYFSLNPFLPDAQNRCPLACAYCVCHQDRTWHHHPERYADSRTPPALIESLLDEIFATHEGRQGFPISLCDYSDPFIPAHQERVLEILRALIARNAASMVYITTKAHPGQRYLDRLAALLSVPNALRVTIFVSLPPIQRAYEPVSVRRRARLLTDLTARGLPCCWYLRPLVENWYDEELMWTLTRELLGHVRDHIILSGIVMSEEVEAELQEKGLHIPAWDCDQAGKKQQLAPEFEARIRSVIGAVAQEQGITLGPIMGHRLCGTNGNHAYGCLVCGKQARYCQLFQIHHYGATVEADSNQELKKLLREGAVVRQRVVIPLEPAQSHPTPSPERCDLSKP